jgi:hypothetical protein
MSADNIVRTKEVEYLSNVVETFDLDTNYQADVENLGTLLALSTIRALSLPQKEMVAQLMGKMVVIDEDINYNEVKLYNAFCESCNINKNFNIDDYPECTLSGPFMNPEDLTNDNII